MRYLDARSCFLVIEEGPSQQYNAKPYFGE